MDKFLKIFSVIFINDSYNILKSISGALAEPTSGISEKKGIHVCISKNFKGQFTKEFRRNLLNSS